MKKCSTSLIIREIQIKTTVKYPFIHIRMVILKDKISVQPLWRTVWRFLKKLKIELPYDLAIPLLGIYLEKTVIQKDTCTPMFIAALFTTAKT